ncbi:MAG: DUF6551 family protein [Candidatus Ornithomonoglobus sp.]
MEDYSEFVPKVHFEQIPIKNLVSNQNYQRNLSQNHIVKAAEHFDLYQINPVKVSRRNGINYVFNGQHTIEIIALVSGSRETPVWCMIYDDLCYEHEADIFANQMKYVKTLQPLEVFAANIEAGNHDQLMIKELVESYGLAIGNKKRNGMISAVSTLESIYYKYGIHVLSRVLRLCIGTWEGEANSLSSNMLNAIAKLIVTYNGILNDEIFKERVGAVPPKIISRTAKERRPGSLGYAEAIIIAYNGKRKSSHGKLFINKLYEKDFSIIDEDEDYIDDESCDSGTTDKNL